MSIESWTLYKYWLNRRESLKSQLDKDFVAETVESLKNTAAYQETAKRNGTDDAIIATRSETNKCSVTVLPGHFMYIGDLVNVFNENWLCKELYTDEYNVTYAELWMCNHTFVYQDFDGVTIAKPGIIDDGSYSKSSDKSIPVADGTYKCFISFDEESKALYVDKRLALDTIYNQDGEPILEVGKVTWLDNTTYNFGDGSHLLAFNLKEDVYDSENDNLELMICDYVTPSDDEGDDKTSGYLVIEGRDSLRIGTSRTYKVSAVDADGNSCNAPDTVTWSITADESIRATPTGSECVVTVPADDALIGKTISISCVDSDGNYTAATKEVGVIALG